eukprot:10714688-Karenia_brevis.AAC.1
MVVEHACYLRARNKLSNLSSSITPAIAQLVEHLTEIAAAIGWSLVRFRVAGFTSCRIAHDRGLCCSE